MADKAVEKTKSIRQIRIHFSDLTTEDNDPFIRYWIKVYGNRGLGNRIEAEGNMSECSCILVRTSRSQLIAF